MSNQTVKFDSSTCTTPDTHLMYKNVCQNSAKCMEDMQHFCNTQIHTNKEFNIQADLLQCITQCGLGEKCKKDCVESL